MKMENKKFVYLDSAATTYVEKEVLDAMIPYFIEKFGNPGSFHDIGLVAREAIEDARARVAKILNCKSNEVIFTSGGTESINFALKGITSKHKSKGNHIITSKIEHHAVLHVCEYLEKQGFEITYIDVDKFGRVNPEDVKKAIRKETLLISIMYANNEIGTVQSIREIGKIAREKGVYFHTDACQAAGALDLNVSNLNVDLLTLNGSKIYGPKGIGILFVKSGIDIEPLIHGGGQEFDKRSGTENVPFIIGFAKALEIADHNKEVENEKLIELRDFFIEGLLKLPKTRLNGHPIERLPNNINISILDIEGEAMLLYLNEKGIYASTGSACASKSLETSHVLRAIGLAYEASHGSLRFTLGRKTKMDDIKYVLSNLPHIVEVLKKLSPLDLKMEHYV